MADTKLADLTALTAPAGTDLLYAVADPAGTPADRKITFDDLFKRPAASSINWTDLFLTRRAAANLRLGAADVGATTSTVTITIAAPGVVTWSSHGFSTGTPVVFTTTGALPTGITAGTTYYAVVVDANTFQIASSAANAIAATPTVITTSGTQSGTHTGTRYNITQRLGMQSNTGVTDRLGADLIIQGSQGTGTGAGGSIIFQVAPAGSSGTAQNALADALTITSTRQIVLGGTGSTTASITSSAGSTSGIGFNSGEVVIVRSGNIHSIFNSTGLDVNIANARVAVPNGGYFVVGDAYLYRDAANTLALRNGANAQTFRLYNTWTSFGTGTEIWERGKFAWESNVLTIGTEKGANGGTARALEFQTDGTTRLTIASTGAATFASTLTVGTSTNGLVFDPGLDGIRHWVSSGIKWEASGYGLYLSSALAVTWSNSSSTAKSGIDTGLARAAANIVRVTNGSTGGGSLQLTEMTAPAAPATDNVRIYAEDNGSGKTRLMALFPTGAAVQIAIEP